MATIEDTTSSSVSVKPACRFMGRQFNGEEAPEMGYCVTSDLRSDRRFRQGYRWSPSVHITPARRLARRHEARGVVVDHHHRDVAGVIQRECHLPLWRIAREEKSAFAAHVPRARNGLQSRGKGPAEVIGGRQHALRPRVVGGIDLAKAGQVARSFEIDGLAGRGGCGRLVRESREKGGPEYQEREQEYPHGRTLAPEPGGCERASSCEAQAQFA